MFNGLFDSGSTTVIDISDFVACIGCALVIGLILTFSYMYKTRYTKSFVVTLALLPAVVSVVIMMVNGNVGTGVAVAGAFSLVRFRSIPGTAKEIGMLFLAMASGLIIGMGYIGLAFVFVMIMCFVNMIYNYMDFGVKKNASIYKTIRITIPEDLDYSEVFDSLFEEYTKDYELVKVKTTNLGSMFRLTYNIILKDEKKEKEMIDRIRCRNGNLDITISKQETVVNEL